MELNYLRNFYEVAKSGSFTEAARRLRISQSALSKTVALLEHRQKVQLLSRSKKGVTLTPKGTEVFERCERLFAMVKEIEGVCQDTAEVCEGPLRFGASDHISNYLLIEPLKAMQSEYPGVIPRVVAGTPHDIVTQILADEIEFGLFFTKVNLPTIKYERLAALPMALVCHPSLMKEKTQALSFIGSARARYLKPRTSSFIRQLTEDPKVSLESNSQEMQKRFCLAGGGVAYLAEFMVRQELESGELVEIPLKKKMTADIHLAVRRQRRLSLPARTFLERYIPKWNR